MNEMPLVMEEKLPNDDQETLLAMIPDERGPHGFYSYNLGPTRFTTLEKSTMYFTLSMIFGIASLMIFMWTLSEYLQFKFGGLTISFSIATLLLFVFFVIFMILYCRRKPK